MRNKLQEIHELREKAGISFKQSFRCKDADKNIHLLDIKTFFKKIKERLDKMGYDTSDDFDFNVVRHKFDYAERHHVGRSYEWKYFYSSTFQISDDLIDYLVRHNFIFPKLEKYDWRNKPQKPKKQKVELSREELIVKYEQCLAKSKNQIINFEERIRHYSELKNEELVRNYKGAIRKYKHNIVELENKLEELYKAKGEENNEV